MRKVLVAGIVGISLLAGCDYTPSPQQLSQDSSIGGTGNIQFSVEELTPSKRFLTVTAAPGIGETEGSIKQRIYQFAVRFAAKECPNEYRFVDDPNMSQALAAGFMRRTRSYVIQCTS
ncbi:hypothetical protein [Amylibacter sp. IMCC11727]|uniref:hypothetical protein n=1 Tax=Amylibacter sp. IMCC11727 TaxID=3039851 RepID=UPI00244DE067|nr:hypothetical protein [Amylibacter sp. IMCC11727]WGI21232.1 hypothetical protein QBD29_14095 [Amylibacter sp. IMCC11727]